MFMSAPNAASTYKTPSPVRLGVALPLVFGAIGLANAYDVTDQFAINGLIAAGGQCQDVSATLPSEDYDESGLLDTFDNTCRGGMPIELELDFKPTERDEFFARFAWAVGNALNEVSPFQLAPWAVDLEDDVTDINGSGRDYLMLAWYKHSFDLGDDNKLSTTFGIIDTSDYLDGNAYANHKYNQFMNEVFVNSGNYGLPAYDAGMVLEAAVNPFTFTAVGINVSENDDGNNFNFWGAQLGWHPSFELGDGNYRFMIAGTSSDFLDPAREKEENRLTYGVSFDQELGDIFGVFLRVDGQSEDAAVTYKSLYSGGINIAGSGWRRPDDNIGIGYAYLSGGNLDVDHTNAFEAYYRMQFDEFFALSADVQYMSDSLARIDPAQDNPDGWIFGLRATAGF